MPVEFRLEPTDSSDNSLFGLSMAYDGSGRRISKTRWVKKVGSQDWEKELVTHYTGIGTEVRESFTGANAETKVVVNMPNGLGRYGIEDAAEQNSNASKTFEWYLKNHLGSTMLVYGTVASTDLAMVDVGEKIAAYDYRAFGEMVELTPPPTDKVTENFTGKEHDDEIALDYFGARYLDPMLGMWISVDTKRQFDSPYLYAGNGMNPVNVVDPDGNATWSLGINGSANAWLVGVSGSMSVKLNTNPKNFGDVIHFGIATRAGLACAKGASSRVRVGYSPDGPSSGLNHAIVNSMTVPTWLKPPVVLGISEASDINTDNKTYTVEAGVGLEGGLDAVHAETSFDFSLGDAFDALIKFKDYMVNSAKDYMTNVNDRAKDIMENPDSYAP